MLKKSMQENWLFAQGTITMMELFLGKGDRIEQIDLPHDAMIHRERTKETKNAHQTGFYPGGEYTYLRKWMIPADWKYKNAILEFEGIADISRIYLNGELLKIHYNPYSGISIDVSKKLLVGQENELKVEVLSVEQSSRWYSGAGMYRPVFLWVGTESCILEKGLRIRTKEASEERAVIAASIPVKNTSCQSRKYTVKVELKDACDKVVSAEQVRITVPSGEKRTAEMMVEAEHPELWSDVTPNLYQCSITLFDEAMEEILDQCTKKIGIRTLSLSAAGGFRVNGVETKLRGTCIHHDNGVIGAATFADAEWKRCRELKEAGFNAIRSSHHPVSKYMLEACDALGIYVMDEISDMWTRTKNPNDYANYFANFWEEDVTSMIEKDYNHPSVVIYSTGNELPEAGTAFGAEWNRRIDAKIKSLDDTRYTTCGINGLMAAADRMGEIIAEASGMSMEELAAMQQMEAENGAEKGAGAGADEVNGMADVMVGPLAEAIAVSSVLESMIGEFAGVNDIAGYNYLTGLHEEEHRRHPNRVVLGTETFPAEIVHLWDIVKRNSHVLGDFTWTGYDYLGEAGCGIFHYDGGVNFSAHWPDRLAGIGDIDILGDRKPISYLRQAVFGIGHAPAIGVMRMDKAGKEAGKTPWMWKDNLASWTWHGYEGKTASVDVYANAEEVELFLNGESMGRKALNGEYIAVYELPYRPGKLEAVSYVDGKAVGKTMLQTAGEAKKLLVETDRTCLRADGESLAFVKIRLADKDGFWNRQESRRITVKTEGEISLQGFGSANPSCEGSYQSDTWESYDGSVMAVIRAGKAAGEAAVTITAEGCEPECIRLKLENE